MLFQKFNVITYKFSFWKFVTVQCMLDEFLVIFPGSWNHRPASSSGAVAGYQGPSYHTKWS
jgi:hypothetical protein